MTEADTGAALVGTVLPGPGSGSGGAHPTGPTPAWAGWVRGAARRRADRLRARWQDRDPAHAADPARSVHADIDDTLDDPGFHPPADPEADRLAAAVLAEGPFARLVAEFGLTRPECELLALLAVDRVDPRWGRVLGYLADDLRPAPVTAAAAAALWAWPPGTAIGPASALLRWEIATPTGPVPWSADAPWTVDPDLVGYLCDTPEWWGFHSGLTLLPPARDTECFHPGLLAELTATVRTALAAGAPCEVELIGVPGAGRRTLLRQLGHALGRPVLDVADPGLGRRAVRTARLLGAVPLWSDEAGAPIPVDTRPGALTLIARGGPGPQAAGAVARITRAVPELDRRTRLAFWSDLTLAEPPAAVREWTLTPAELVAAAASAAAGPRAATAATRRKLGAVSASLLSPLPCPYSWDDLVVGDSVRERLRGLESQVRLRSAVLDDWGFHRLTPGSRGATALFAGPSGTGKTMAAQVLAHSLDLELYRVDLAQVVDKYIGETEKRLARVFDECERCRVLVLFDEADALFGQRTQVRDAHDRFANIEIDYLLQRMESFDGVAILATNRKGDLDAAFLRRLRVVVDFLAPTADERLRLWQLALPDRAPDGTPVAAHLDRRWLADELVLTGAEIKGVTLAAAYLARAEDQLIGMAHVLRAARDELAKRGAVLRAPAPANGHAVRIGGVR